MMAPAVICDTQQNNLQISEDIDLDGKPIAVLLFTPDMTNTGNHHHIDIDRVRATALKQWLQEFLERLP